MNETVMVTYDPSVIHQHASRLYDRALGIIVVYAFGYGILGLFAGGLVGSRGLRDINGVAMVLGALSFALLGAAIGRARGFELRLQAQTALCQVQIELNTRSHSISARANASLPNPPRTP